MNLIFYVVATFIGYCDIHPGAYRGPVSQSNPMPTPGCEATGLPSNKTNNKKKSKQKLHFLF